MTNLFVSTSRKPSAQTRKLSRWLALLLGGKSENRGKRSVDEVMQRAAAQGYSRVLFIHDKNGNPAELVFRDEAEGWLEPSVAISGVFIPEKGKRVRVPKEVAAKPLDSDGRKIAGLFGLEASSGEEEALLLVAGAREIFFETEAGGERIGPVIRIARLASRKEIE